MNDNNQKQLTKIIQKEYDNITGMIIQKHGKIVYEYYPEQYSSDNYFHIYSVTKSIISILIGIAIDKGYIKNTNQKVLEFFPEYQIKKGEKTIQKITINDILTMTAPYKYKIPPLTYMRYFMSKNWVTFTLNVLGGKKEIGAFYYTPLVGPDILSGILTKATGKSVFDFATEHLFAPLGITVKQNIVFHSAKEQQAFNKASNISGWVVDPMGINSAGWGLTLSALDMAKIGQLYLNRGMWNGIQIVSQDWIMDSTTEHSKWDKMDLPYGYLWWIVDKEEEACAAMGDGGNVIYFNQEKEIVIAITSLLQKKVKDRIDFIKNEVEPRIK